EFRRVLYRYIQKEGGRRQEEGGRRQKAGGRRQKAGGRRQEAEGRRQKAEGRRQEAEGRRQEGKEKEFCLFLIFFFDMELDFGKKIYIRPSPFSILDSPFPIPNSQFPSSNRFNTRRTSHKLLRRLNISNKSDLAY
ncbi:MAG: hypothetical protein F6K41_31180, partial [Symploca sp. SIO3E6]|nr:hypothetical protein [Caldora sp. SIO3E6]